MLNRKTLILLILIPIVYTLLFGGLFSRNLLTNLPIIICNLDDGFESQNLIQNFYDTPELKVIAIEANADYIVNFMLENDSVGAVVIPKNYSKDINSGNSTSIELIIDNTNRSVGGTVTKAVQSILTSQNTSFTLSSRVLYNPTGGYIDFFLAALIMHSTQIAIVFSIAPFVVAARNTSNFSLSYMFRLLLICSAIEIGIIALCLSIGIGFFDMLCRGSFLEIMLLNTAFILCMVSFAICVGSLLNEEYKTLMTPLVYIMPSIMFANVTWPRHSMDTISLVLSYVMPIGYAADDLRSLFIKGTAADLQLHIIILLAMAILFFVMAIIGVKYHAAKTSPRISTTDM